MAAIAYSAASAVENDMTTITFEPGYHQQLKSLVAPAESLKRAGYVLRELTDGELERKKRCTACNTRPTQATRWRAARSQAQKPEQPPVLEAQEATAEGTNLNAPATEQSPSKPRCKFHPGNVISKTWTCCGKPVPASPCVSKDDHDVREGLDLTIRRRWQFHNTPNKTKPGHRLAVAIDCEMGTAFDGDCELIRLTVIDYFSCEILIDSLVYPDITMQHFNTRYSGVTRGNMERARRERRCIMGRDAARGALFKYVGPSTVVVGHGAQSDLSALRWIHHQVVDFYVIELARQKAAELKAEQERKEREGDNPEEEVPGSGEKRGKRHQDGLSLKALAMRKLGRAIQVGKGGHDSLEDALAVRDLVHAHIANL